MRPLVAWSLHRIADRLITAAKMIQAAGFWVEFGHAWRDRKEEHYRQRIAREHYWMNSQ